MNTTQVRIVDDVLSGSLATTNKNFISDKILPTVKVSKDSIKVPTWGNEHLAVGSDHHAPGALFNRFDSTLSDVAYALQEYGVEQVIPQEFTEVADRNLQLEMSISNLLNERGLLTREFYSSSKINATANYGSNSSPTIKWNSANSVAITDIQNGKSAVVNAIGMEPNTVLFGRNAWQAFIFSAQVASWRNTTNSYTIGTADAAKLLDVENVYIGNSVYDSNGTVTQLFDEICSIVYVTPSPSPLSMTWGYTFVLNGYPAIERYISDERRSTVIRYVDFFVHAVTNKNAGYLLTNCVL